MRNNQRWIAFAGALLLAAMVGFAAWQAGVSHGIEQSGKILVPPSGAAGPYPYPYHWHGHGPWGFGFLFVPLFVLFWIFVLRGLFWRRAWGGGGCGPYGRFEEWHRQAHAREAGQAPPPGAGER